LIASSARRSRLDSWAAVGCGWHATVRNFRQIGVPPPLTTPATVIPCKKCKRRPGYPIDARRRWRGWRRTARILGGSCSGPALSRPPIRARPAQPEARAVFRWRHGALGGVVAKCKGDNPEHHQDGSGYYHQMRKFHWAPHFFFFNPSSTSRRTAAASDGWSFCLAAQFLIRSCISSCIRTPTIGELPVAGRPRAFLGLSLIDFAISRSIG